MKDFYARTMFSTGNEVRRIQLKCLELLDIVDRICRRHNISYSLCGGSVVGAHLYGGCLPWDDDIDVMMNRENYNRFLLVVRDELPAQYSICNYQFREDFYTPFTKIIHNDSTLVQQDGTVSGIFLDITVYDRIPDDCREKIDIFLWKISQVVGIGSLHDKSMKSFFRNMMLRLFFRNKRQYFLLFQKAVEFLGKAGKYHYSELFGAYCNTKAFSPEIFENYAEIMFEGRKCMIVRDYIKYLETRYERTDFREPSEKQIAPHYQYVNLDLPYAEYLRCRAEKRITE